MKKNAPPVDPLRTLRLDQAVLEARRLREAGQIDQAAKLVAGVVQAEPGHVAALRLMAGLAMQTGAPDIAVGCLSRALTVAPRSVDLLIELGEALLAGARPAEAISAFRKALNQRPGDSAAFRGLAQAQLDMGDRTGALASFRKALAIVPYDRYVAHMIAALSGQASPAAGGYVPSLFDTYADTFDVHLTGTLGYRVPQAIRDMVMPRLSPSAALLDLGCGTGLVGAALRDIVAVMDGIDIAPRMTRKALERDIYRHLRTGNSVAVLAADPALSGPYDLVTAADVFIYVGQLEDSFAAIARRLAPGGLVAFSVETADDGDVAIRSSGRYAHSHAYVTHTAAAYGLTIIEQQDMPIRQERNLPIPGRLYLLTQA